MRLPILTGYIQPPLLEPDPAATDFGVLAFAFAFAFAFDDAYRPVPKDVASPPTDTAPAVEAATTGPSPVEYA